MTKYLLVFCPFLVACIPDLSVEIPLEDTSCDPEPQSALTCFAHHVVSAAPGVLSVLMVPGPYDTQLEHLIITLGDGTALTQVRFRAQTGCEWELRVHQLCDVEVDPAVEAACDGGDDQGCIWMPGLTSCRGVADWTCADVTAALD